MLLLLPGGLCPIALKILLRSISWLVNQTAFFLFFTSWKITCIGCHCMTVYSTRTYCSFYLPFFFFASSLRFHMSYMLGGWCQIPNLTEAGKRYIYHVLHYVFQWFCMMWQCPVDFAFKAFLFVFIYNLKCFIFHACVVHVGYSNNAIYTAVALVNFILSFHLPSHCGATFAIPLPLPFLLVKNFNFINSVILEVLFL